MAKNESWWTRLSLAPDLVLGPAYRIRGPIFINCVKRCFLSFRGLNKKRFLALSGRKCVWVTCCERLRRWEVLPCTAYRVQKWEKNMKTYCNNNNHETFCLKRGKPLVMFFPTWDWDGALAEPLKANSVAIFKSSERHSRCLSERHRWCLLVQTFLAGNLVKPRTLGQKLCHCYNYIIKTFHLATPRTVNS